MPRRPLPTCSEAWGTKLNRTHVKRTSWNGARKTAKNEIDGGWRSQIFVSMNEACMNVRVLMWVCSWAQMQKRRTTNSERKLDLEVGPHSCTLCFVRCKWFCTWLEEEISKCRSPTSWSWCMTYAIISVWNTCLPVSSRPDVFPAHSTFGWIYIFSLKYYKRKESLTNLFIISDLSKANGSFNDYIEVALQYILILLTLVKWIFVLWCFDCVSSTAWCPSAIILLYWHSKHFQYKFPFV